MLIALDLFTFFGIAELDDEIYAVCVGSALNHWACSFSLIITFKTYVPEACLLSIDGRFNVLSHHEKLLVDYQTSAPRVILASGAHSERMFTSHNRMLNKTIFVALRSVFTILEALLSIRTRSESISNHGTRSEKLNTIVYVGWVHSHATTSTSSTLFACKQMAKWSKIREFLLPSSVLIFPLLVLSQSFAFEWIERGWIYNDIAAMEKTWKGDENLFFRHLWALAKSIVIQTLAKSRRANVNWQVHS